MSARNLSLMRVPQRRPSTPAQSWMRALEATAGIGAEPCRILPTIVADNAERYGDAPALLSDRESLSYRDLAGRARQYARFALNEKIAQGDVVALMMSNRPEFVAIWLGLTQIGAVVALLNTGLVGPSLAHCISVANPKHAIVEADLATAFLSLPDLPPGMQLWLHAGDIAGKNRLDTMLNCYGTEALSAAEARPIALVDPALLIYTSGTTGLPKAARVSHHRIMMWSAWFYGMTHAQADDRMYDCLPLYHSVGGIVAVGAMLIAGGSVVIRDKFSARHFWDDVLRWDCTLFQYIGELCRYLVSAPVHPRETEHRLRLCCGNGLRMEIWNAFKERFRIPHILEFYAATEGSFSLFNAEEEPGAIGRVPPILAHRFPPALVKFDSESGVPLRDAAGFCIPCVTDEIGEAIGRLKEDETNFAARFEGYTDEADSRRKILRHVFAEGDAWFRTGDLMRKNAKGFFYFVDRVGDTFRWKGENVASLEVEDALRACPGVMDASVYGVTVPHTEGRAGMAALVVEPCFDLVALHKHLAERLPDPARPLFLRMRKDIALTETFKPKKREIAAEGYDPARIADALFFDDRSAKVYVPLDQAMYEAFQAGQRRL